MLRKRSLTLCLLALLFASVGSFAPGARAQQSAAEGEFVAVPEEAYVLFQNESGETICRVANAAERARINRQSGDTHVIYRGAPLRRKIVHGNEVLEANSSADNTGLALLPSAGLTIVLEGTAQLDANPTAKNAFIIAANRWEAIISTPITITLKVDYGTTFFGEEYGDANILGQTGSFIIKSNGNDPSLSTVRQRLIASGQTASELELYNALPSSSVPVEFNGTTVSASSVRVNTALARAIGFNLAAGTDAQIGFNSNFGNGGQFDFNPDDGIASGQTDFDSVVTHEIGHALGFSSANGGANSSPLTVWDLFRFRPSTVSVSTFATAPRAMTKGGTQVFFGNFTSTFATQELSLSTGGPNPPEGDTDDGRQSSHWKADELLSTRPYIGIMDPTLSRSLRRTISENDIRAIDLLGYSVAFNPTRPANDNFASAADLQGASGNFTGTSVFATREAGEPLHAGFQGDKSVWFTWTAPTTGPATFDTVGSNFDTTLSVYRGTTVSFLATDATNDDMSGMPGGASRVQFNTTAGTVYRIAVDGWNGEFGNVSLNWTSSGTQPTPTPTPTPTQSFSITGRVQDPSGNGIGGVRVAIDGPALVNTFPHLPVTTDAAGNFQFSLLTPGGNYTVRSDDSRYIFTPPTATFNGINANHTGVNFTATLNVTSVTGRIMEGAQGLQGALVGFYSGTTLLQQMTTGTDGRWTFNGAVIGQAYNVFFVKGGYNFSQPGMVFPMNVQNQDMGDVFATKGNPIGASDFFVTQHYEDFLGRQPDSSGLNFWTNNIESCGLNIQCREVRRIDTSAAFFLSIEFQETGFLVYRAYQASFGNAFDPTIATAGSPQGYPVPVIRRAEFLGDMPIISQGVQVNVGEWRQQLEINKQSFMLDFVGRQRFTNAFPSTMTADAFVGLLDQNAGGVLSAAERAALVDIFGGGAASSNDAAKRALVLRSVAENAALAAKEKNRAFVLMQYYGYLRRDPNTGPNTNYSGYKFWLDKLNQFGGDHKKAEMVKAFLDSSEYRGRFGQP